MIGVYILYSKKLSKYYVGSSKNIEERLSKHNSNHSGFTSKGRPWDLIYSMECKSIQEALKLERRIKKRGIRRFLESRGVAPRPTGGHPGGSPVSASRLWREGRR